MRYHYNQCTLGYSIVPQPRKAFTFHGSEMNCVGTFSSLAPSLAFTISMISHADCLKIGFVMNKEAVDPCTFKKLYMSNMDELLGGG